MARNPDKYIYVEVALPKNNLAIKKLIDEANSTGTPLRSQIRISLIRHYSEGGVTGLQPQSQVKPTDTRRERKHSHPDDDFDPVAEALDMDDDGLE